jgi:acyl carrier protein
MQEKLLLIINNILEKKEKKTLNEFDKNLSLRTDLGFDSLELAELTVRIEDQFDIDIFEHRIVDKLYEILEELER